MIFKQARFDIGKDYKIHFYSWLPDDEPKAVLQISHGMAEHGARYEKLGEFLTSKGIAVYACDHPGHGKTVDSIEDLGYKSDDNFWEAAHTCMTSFNSLIQGYHPDKPIYLMGHSMGSILARHWASIHGDKISGLILSATAGDPGVLGKIGLGIAKGVTMFQGRNKKSPLLKQLSFGKFNDAFQPNRTEFDWLNTMEEGVDEYINDPLCGGMATAGFWVDFLGGIGQTNAAKTYEETPKELPIYLFAGDQDPVGNNAEAVKKVAHLYRSAGVQQVDCKIYKGGRHEMLHEKNAAEVMDDLHSWIGDISTPTT